MPRLSERSVIFENELTDEAVEFRPDQIAHDVDHRGIFGELFENRIAMQPEDFADVVFRISCERIRFLLGQYEYVWNPFTRGAQAANLHHSRMHRAALLRRRETANNEEAFLVPVAPMFDRKHPSVLPRYASSLRTESAIAVPAKNSGSALR